MHYVYLIHYTHRPQVCTLSNIGSDVSVHSIFVLFFKVLTHRTIPQRCLQSPPISISRIRLAGLELRKWTWLLVNTWGLICCYSYLLAICCSAVFVMYWAAEVPIKLPLFLPPLELSLVTCPIAWKCLLLPDLCVRLFCPVKIMMNLRIATTATWVRLPTDRTCYFSQLMCLVAVELSPVTCTVSVYARDFTDFELSSSSCTSSREV